MDEKAQAYWKAFWPSPEGIRLMKMFIGLDKIERE